MVTFREIAMLLFSHSAGGIVVGPEGKILLVQQRGGMWSFPKGGIKEGENPAEAALREVREETGIRDLRLHGILKSYKRHSLTDTGREDRDTIKRITMYLFTTQERDPYPMDPRMTQARWADPAEVPRLLAHPKDIDFFLEMLPEIQKLGIRSYTC